MVRQQNWHMHWFKVPGFEGSNPSRTTRTLLRYREKRRLKCRQDGVWISYQLSTDTKLGLVKLKRGSTVLNHPYLWGCTRIGIWNRLRTGGLRVRLPPAPPYAADPRRSGVGLQNQRQWVRLPPVAPICAGRLTERPCGYGLQSEGSIPSRRAIKN